MGGAGQGDKLGQDLLGLGLGLGYRHCNLVKNHCLSDIPGTSKGWVSCRRRGVDLILAAGRLWPGLRDDGRRLFVAALAARRLGHAAQGQEGGVGLGPGGTAVSPACGLEAAGLAVLDSF